MNKIRIPKSEIDVYEDIINNAKENIITGNTRWSIYHEVVFPWKGKYYKTSYSEGATEQQDERPFEYDNFINAEEVHQVAVMSLRWLPVEESKIIEE